MDSSKYLPENIRDTELFTYITSLIDWIVSVNHEDFVQRVISRFDVQQAKFDPEYMIRFLGSEDFLEISKTTRSSFVYDSSGYGRSGIASRVLYKSDIGPDFTGCFQFDGEGNVRTTGFKDTNTEGTEITASIWVKASSQDGSFIWCHGDSDLDTVAWQMKMSGATNSKFEVVISRNGRLELIYYKQYISSYIIGDNRWHQVAFKFKNGVLDLFVDGEKDLNVVKVADNELYIVYNSSSDLVVGAELSNGTAINRISGYLDDPRIYNVALDDSVLHNMFKFIDIPTTNLQLYYDFNMSQDQLKTLALLVSNLSNLKGTLKGIQYIFRLLNLDAVVYEWFHINEEWAGSNPEFPTEADPCSIIIDVNIGDYPLDEEIQDQLVTLLDALLWTCVTIMEIRWRKSFTDTWDQPPDTIGIIHYLDITDYASGADSFPFQYCPILPSSYYIKLAGGEGNHYCEAQANPIGATTVIAGPSVFYPDYLELITHTGQEQCDILFDLTGYKFGFGCDDTFTFENTNSLEDTVGESEEVTAYLISDGDLMAKYEASGLAPERNGLNFEGNNGSVGSGGGGGVDLGVDFIGISASTFETWIKVESLGENNAGTLIDNGKFIAYLADNGSDYKVVFSSDGGGTFAESDGGIEIGLWVHIAITRDSLGVTNIYLNGTQSGTVNQASGTPAGGTNNLFWGNRAADDRTFDGIMDEVRLWSVVRSQVQIEANYDVELEGDEANLLGYWRCNEPDGVILYDAVQPPTTAHNGTIVGGLIRIAGAPVPERLVASAQALTDEKLWYVTSSGSQLQEVIIIA